MYYLLKPWVNLPGMSFLIIIIGLIMRYQWRRFGNIIFFIGLASLILLSMPIVTYNLANLMENQYRILTTNDLAHPKSNYAIVVLGGGNMVQAEYAYKLSVSNFTFNRLAYGEHLRQKMHLPLIVSGGKASKNHDSEANIMNRMLQKYYGSRADFIEDKSKTTAEESQFILPILQKNNIKGVYLVTHAWHMPRSVYIFRHAGITVIPAPMGHYYYRRRYALISYFPNMDALYASSKIVHELIGLLWYKIKFN